MGAINKNLAKSGAALAVVALLLASATTADAAMMMRLTQGANVVTITDGGGNDSNALAGVITYIGGVGTFTINVSTGISQGPALANMDLNSVNQSNAPGGNLIIELTDTDFLPAGVGRLRGSVGGTTRGSAVFSVCKNESNVEFDCNNPAAQVNLGPFVGTAGNPLAFSASGTDKHGPVGPYSLTLIASIAHGASNGVTTSFDFDIDNVPEPASIALFGLGLLGAGAASRLRRRKTS